jgi:hypothetical protein
MIMTADYSELKSLQSDRHVNISSRSDLTSKCKSLVVAVTGPKTALNVDGSGSAKDRYLILNRHRHEVSPLSLYTWLSRYVYGHKCCSSLILISLGNDTTFQVRRSHPVIYSDLTIATCMTVFPNGPSAISFSSYTRASGLEYPVKFIPHV